MPTFEFIKQRSDRQYGNLFDKELDFLSVEITFIAKM